MRDFTVTNQGTVFTLTPNTATAHGWALDHLPDDAPMLGHTYVVEHRYIGDIVQGIVNDGLTVE